MTTRAREVLADCEHALTDFKRGANTEYQWTRWVAFVTMLRAVGHVLKQVDWPASDAKARQRIDAAHNRLQSSKPEPGIYWQFIVDERNIVVKEYAVRAAVNITVRPATGTLSFSPVLAGQAASGIGAVPTTVDFVMRDGTFKGRDPLELAREAIEFWRAHLDDIDRP